MFLPETGPTTRDAVKARLSITDDTDDAAIDRTVAAVNVKLSSWPVSDKARKDTQAAADAAGWPADVVEGATLLVMRLWRRKDTPGGYATIGDVTPVYVVRNDPDVAMLLELGEHGRPAVG